MDGSIKHENDRFKRHKITSAAEAVALIHSGDTLGIGGFVGIGFAEELALALRHRFLCDRQPNDLTLVYAAGQGDGKERGLNQIALPGLIKRVIGGHWGLAPALQELANQGKIEAYNLPQGCLTHLYRDIAAGKPGLLTKVGLETYVDPFNDGGKLNSNTQEDMVKRINIEGEDYLFYKAFPINVAFIRGTTADESGNISCEREALILESLALAMAVHNCGGLVIAQVERVAEAGSLNPRDVKIPGILVDCVVVGKPEHHWQTFSTVYNPAFASEIRVPMTSLKPLNLDTRKIIARRAAFELRPNAIVNLGIGMPEGLANVANEEHLLDKITLTAEPGLIGGLPASGLDFGAGINMDALIDQPAQFDFYDGGGLDIAFLGMAQVDSLGNVNVSKFGPRLAGCGGFINISQNAKRLVFMGTFTAGKTEIRIDNCRLVIGEDKQEVKFVDRVEHLTFSGSRAARLGQQVLYVTERCVFKLTPTGLQLIEIAPGINLEKDILSVMGFNPELAENIIPMDSRIFIDSPMKLDEDLLIIPLKNRIRYDAEKNTVFLNFEALHVKVNEDIFLIKNAIEEVVKPIGKPVKGVVNYDNFSIPADLIAAYAEMVSNLVKTYYKDVTRYTTSAFLRMKLGESLASRGVAPHIFESEYEAKRYIDRLD